MVLGKVASLFSDDVGRVTGHKLRIINFGKENLHLSHAIIVGTLKGNSAIRDIVRKGKLILQVCQKVGKNIGFNLSAILFRV